MSETPHSSWLKRQLHKLKGMTPRGQAHEFTTSACLGWSDHPLSHSPNILQESNQRLEAPVPVLSVPPPLAPGHLTALSHESTEVVTGVMEMAASVSVSPAPSSTHGQIESRLSHNFKVAAKGALWALGKAAEGLPIPGAKAIFTSIYKIIDVVEVAQENQEGFRILANQCKELMDTTLEPLKDKDLAEIPPMLRDSLDELKGKLTGLLSKVEQKSALGILSHAFNHEENIAIIKDMNNQVQHFLDLYKLNIGTWTMMMLQQAHHRQVLMQLRQDLHQSTAGYDDISSYERASCLTGTRENLLTKVKAWIEDHDMDKPIYVLYGIAGIGKTTVAQTVAEYAASRNLLGASFFFSRAKEDRKSGDHFFSTLASQLAQYDVHLADQIASALLSVPGAPLKALEFQMKHLIVEPIKKAKLSQSPVIVVIDALDECQWNHAIIILDLLGKSIQSMPNFKIFITTRPESHIQEKLLVQNHLLPFHLHEIEMSVAKGDIELYLRHQLSQNQVAEVLPGIIWQATEAELIFLAEQCGIMFIIAATAVKYILDKKWKEPSHQITLLFTGLDIEEGDQGVMNSLDKMYLGILNSAVPIRRGNLYLERFQRIIGAIIVLQDPLPMAVLAKMVDMERLHVETTLQDLHSIIAPESQNQAPQLYHKSFPDFITDKKRCKDSRFYIHLEQQHAKIAELCFKVMDEIHANITGFQGVQIYMSNAEMGDWRTKNITDELKYACIHWATHISKAGNNNTESLGEKLYSFAFIHLLHWIEVLSLVGKLEVAYPAMILAQETLKTWEISKTAELNAILNDGCRYVTRFYDIIKISASHIYHSTLPFVPYESQLYKTYKLEARHGFSIIKGQEVRWNPLLTTLRGHSDSVSSISFSSDGSRLASGSDDMTVRLWNGLTGAHIATLEGHSDIIQSVTFSPDGSRIASASYDNTIRIWNGLTGAYMATLEPESHSYGINIVVFSPDGSRLASGSFDDTVRLWDGIMGTHRASLKGHSDTVWSVAFSSSGFRLASGSNDRSVRLWDGLTGEKIAVLEGHTSTVRSIIFSPDSSRLVSGSDDHTVRLWDGLTGAHVATLVGHSGIVWSIVFSPDGSKLASVSYDGTIRLWNGLTGVHMTTLKGHLSAVWSVAFSSDGSRLTSGSCDGTVRIWNGQTGAQMATLEDHSDEVNTVTFSPDGSRLASGSDDKTVMFWDGLVGTHTRTLEDHSNRVRSVVFSPDGSRLVSASSDNTVRLWDGITGAHISTLEGHSDLVQSIAFSFDSSRLASASYDKTVRIWSGKTRAQMAILEGHLNIVQSVSFSPAGSKLASGSYDNTIKLWDWLTGTHMATLTGHSGVVWSIAFSCDGLRIASGSADNTTRLWDGLTGAHIATLTGHSSTVWSVAFSDDGSKLASGSYDGNIRLWDGLMGTYTTSLEGHSDIVQSITFSSNGSRLTSEDQAGNKKHWNLCTREPLLNPNEFSSESGSDQYSSYYMILDNAVIIIATYIPVIWLLPEIKVESKAFHGSQLAIGCSNGQVILLDISHLPTYFET